MSLWVVGETVTLSYPSPPGVIAAVVAVHLKGPFVHVEVAGDGEPGAAVVDRIDHLREIVVMLSPYDKRDAVIVGVGGANIDENGHAVGIFRLVYVNHRAGDSAGLADMVAGVIPEVGLWDIQAFGNGLGGRLLESPYLLLVGLLLVLKFPLALLPILIFALGTRSLLLFGL